MPSWNLSVPGMSTPHFFLSHFVKNIKNHLFFWLTSSICQSSSDNSQDPLGSYSSILSLFNPPFPLSVFLLSLSNPKVNLYSFLECILNSLVLSVLPQTQMEETESQLTAYHCLHLSSRLTLTYTFKIYLESNYFSHPVRATIFSHPDNCRRLLTCLLVLTLVFLPSGFNTVMMVTPLKLNSDHVTHLCMCARTRARTCTPTISPLHSKKHEMY